ncbi:glycosyltransferase [Actinomadura sp. LD22]|uniref:Glycosyltransferase n=1 Tax=Actinomadura physcomitrii TaxID=2650748 RepID=A0A6I4MVZ6_9ACTN|nr:glycosyltransferase [Actinomadura physcomitrii]
MMLSFSSGAPEGRACRLSVIVPFYNVEEFLDDCLASIANQTFQDLEVIMVDDGSTDRSGDIARSYVKRDPRFVLLSSDNKGPGAARNLGVERARGELLAFADGDDIVAHNAYELLVHTIEESGSDLVSGGVQRLGPEGVRASALHSRAIRSDRTGTHITKTPRLLYDVTMWNKVVRRSFWDAHEFRFPEGVLYEDIRLAVQLHCLARRVDVLTDVIYYWRERGQGDLSITQRRTDIGNLHDRIEALLAIDEFLRSHGSRRLLRKHQRKALANDLLLYFRDLPRTDDAYRERFLDLVNSYTCQVSARVMRTLTSRARLKFHLAERRLMPELLQFLIWERTELGGAVPTVRRRGRLLADLPFRGDSRLNIPDRVFRLSFRETLPVTRVDSVEWHQGKLRVTGRSYVKFRSITKRRHTSKLLVLMPQRRLSLPVLVQMKSVFDPEATVRSGQERYCYDWGGFECTIDPWRLRAFGRWRHGEWRCIVLVRGRGMWRPMWLHTPVQGRPQRPEHRLGDPTTRVRARWSGRKLVIDVVRLDAALTGHRMDGNELEVTGRLIGSAAARSESLQLLLRRVRGTATLEFPIERLTDHEFRGRVDLSRLTAEVELAERLAGTERTGEGIHWELFVLVGADEPVRLAVIDGLIESRYAHGGREFAVLATRYGNALLTERAFRPVIDEHEWTADGRLILRGTIIDPARETIETVLLRHGSTDRHVFGFERDGDRFTIEIAVTAIESYGAITPIRDGEWRIAVRRPGAAETVPVTYDHASLAALREEPVTYGPKRYRFMCADYDNPIVVVEHDMEPAERGRFNQRVLREVTYHRMMREPLRDAVLFVSWKGKSCSDSPRAIADELRRRGDQRDHIWVVRDVATPAPDGAIVVRQNSLAYYAALAQARYVVSNDDMPKDYVKREGQSYVQTWHGTPLKRIGFDIEQVRFASGDAYLDHLAADVAKWDLLLSPNPFSTEVLARAFRYDGEVLTSGYPRNDLLFAPDTAERISRIREHLGIAADKRVVLYAPTWRDDQFHGGGRYRFNMRLDVARAREQLGDDHVLLIRGHHLMADDVHGPALGDFAMNVTSYPEITDLYLISDILVTDYSSAMFDFACTRRPIVYFTYDLAEYRDQLRGFYFDLEAEAPGPLLSTSDEVIAAIRDIDTISADYKASYDAFVERFCAFDDGRAAARVADRLV